MFSGKTILVAPLDWGLGHASRCVPLIAGLAKDNRVIVGVTSVTAPLLRAYFPALMFVALPSYGIRYSLVLPQWLAVLLQAPRILRTAMREHKLLRKLVAEHAIDLIVSDNRYGLYQRGLPSYFICHQLNLFPPLLPRLATTLHRRFLRHFTAVWVPDYDDHRLTGKLSEAEKALGVPTRFIGPQSALSMEAGAVPALCDVLLLLSGPEPQRSLLEAELLKAFEHGNRRVTLVRGTREGAPLASDRNLTVHDLLAGVHLRGLLQHAPLVVCRSGYSTLMDLHALQVKNAVLIPTPGQPEQEYLASLWAARFHYRVVKQSEAGSFFRTH